MSELRVVATGLRFPEGPVAMPDGSIVLVEIERQTVTRVLPDGRAGDRPDRRRPERPRGRTGRRVLRLQQRRVPVAAGDEPAPSRRASSDYASGSIQRVDPATGAVTVLYDHCGPHKLLGPNDIVFDGHGGFYFTDLGKTRARDREWGGSTTPWRTDRRSSRSCIRC